MQQFDRISMEMHNQQGFYGTQYQTPWFHGCPSSTIGSYGGHMGAYGGYNYSGDNRFLPPYDLYSNPRARPDFGASNLLNSHNSFPFVPSMYHPAMSSLNPRTGGVVSEGTAPPTISFWSDNNIASSNGTTMKENSHSFENSYSTLEFQQQQQHYRQWAGNNSSFSSETNWKQLELYATSSREILQTRTGIQLGEGSVLMYDKRLNIVQLKEGGEWRKQNEYQVFDEMPIKEGFSVSSNTASGSNNFNSTATSEVPPVKTSFAESELIHGAGPSVGVPKESLEGICSNEADLLTEGQFQILPSLPKPLVNQPLSSPTSEIVTCSVISHEVELEGKTVDEASNGVYAHNLFDEMSTRKAVGSFDISTHVFKDLDEAIKQCSDNTYSTVEEVEINGTAEKNCPLKIAKLETVVVAMNKSDNSHIHAPVVPNALPEVVTDTLTCATNEDGNSYVVASEPSGFETTLDPKLGPEFDLESQVFIEDGAMVIKTVEAGGEGFDATKFDEIPTCELMEPIDKVAVVSEDTGETEKHGDAGVGLSVEELKKKSNKLLWSEHVKGGEEGNSSKCHCSSRISLRSLFDVVARLQAGDDGKLKTLNVFEYIGSLPPNYYFDLHSESKKSSSSSIFSYGQQHLFALSRKLDKSKTRETSKVKLLNNRCIKPLRRKVMWGRTLQMLARVFELALDKMTFVIIESACFSLCTLGGKFADKVLWDPGISTCFYVTKGYFYHMVKWLHLVIVSSSKGYVSMANGTMKRVITLPCSHSKSREVINLVTRSYEASFTIRGTVRRMAESIQQVIMFLKTAAKRCININGGSEVDEIFLVPDDALLLCISTLRKNLKSLRAIVDLLKWHMDVQNSHAACGVFFKTGVISNFVEGHVLQCERIEDADIDKHDSFCFSALFPANDGGKREGCWPASRIIHAIAGPVPLVGRIFAFVRMIFQTDVVSCLVDSNFVYKKGEVHIVPTIHVKTLVSSIVGTFEKLCVCELFIQVQANYFSVKVAYEDPIVVDFMVKPFMDKKENVCLGLCKLRGLSISRAQAEIAIDDDGIQKLKMEVLNADIISKLWSFAKDVLLSRSSVFKDALKVVFAKWTTSFSTMVEILCFVGAMFKSFTLQSEYARFYGFDGDEIKLNVWEIDGLSLCGQGNDQLLSSRGIFLNVLVAYVSTGAIWKICLKVQLDKIKCSTTPIVQYMELLDVFRNWRSSHSIDKVGKLFIIVTDQELQCISISTFPCQSVVVDGEDSELWIQLPNGKSCTTRAIKHVKINPWMKILILDGSSFFPFDPGDDITLEDKGVLKGRVMIQDRQTVKWSCLKGLYLEH